MVGVAGLEPTTSASRTLRATNCATPRLTSENYHTKTDKATSAPQKLRGAHSLALGAGALRTAVALSAAVVDGAALARTGGSFHRDHYFCPL